MYRQNFNFLLLGSFPLWNKPICFILEWGTLLERESNCWTFTQFVDWFIWMLTFVCLVFSNAWPRYLLGSLQEGLGRVTLRPCVLCSITLAVLIMSLVVSCVVGPVPTALQRVMLQEGLSWWFLWYIKPSDQTWKFIQDILFCSLGFFFFFLSFCFGTISPFTDWCQVEERNCNQKTCLFLSECGTFSGRRQRFHLVP